MTRNWSLELWNGHVDGVCQPEINKFEKSSEVG